MTAERQELDAWRREAVTLPAAPLGGAAGGAQAQIPAVRAAPSLRARLIFYFVLLVLAVAAIGIFVTTRLVAISATERFDNHLRESARLAADAVARVEGAHLDTLHAMALDETVWPALAAGEARALEASLAPRLLASQADLAAAIDRQGQGVVTLYRQPGTQALTAANAGDFRDLPAASSAVAGQTDELGDKFAALADVAGQAYLVTTAPVRDAQGQIVGALLIGTRLDHLAAQLKADSLADVVLLDEAGQLLATTLPVDPGSNLAELELDTIADLEPGASTGRTVRLYSREFRAAYAPLQVRQTPAGALGVVLPSDYVVNSVAANRSIFLVVFGAATLALLVVGYAVAQSIAGPVLRLHSVATAAASGDLSQQTGLAGSDELGELGRSLDGVVSRLRERSAEARRLYLEVAERDRALAESRARLSAAQQQLIVSERLATVGEISTGLAQDVANPLSHIVGLADVMADQYRDEPELQAEIEAIRANALRARQMVAELLTFARARPLNIALQDMRQTVSNAVNLAGYLARENGVSMSVHVPDQPALAEYDESRIEQVLVNLVRNGIQAMPDGGTLTVGLRATTEAVTVTVQDTGVGISPEHLPRVFDPFFTTEADSGRAGLGLSVSYGIVAAHQGRLDVASQEGRGSIFSLWLPREQPDDAARPGTAAP